MKTRLVIITCLLLLSLLPIPPHVKGATEIFTLSPTDDTYVNNYFTGNHNGPTLEISSIFMSQVWRISRIYLKFDLSGLDYNRIVKAELFLKCYAGTPPNEFDVGINKTGDLYKDSDAPWKEYGLGWSNAPDVGELITKTPVSTINIEKWVSWDNDAMTTYVKDECAKDGIVSMVVAFVVEKCPLTPCICQRNRQFYSDEYCNGGHPYLELTLKPSIESCNPEGTRKDLFNWRDPVYANGSGYSPSSTYDLYILNDVGTWTDGMNIPSYVIKTQVTSDASGKVAPTNIWNNPHTVGKYDILVDVNSNNKYDVLIDALDDNDIEITSGFITVKPQYKLTIIVTGSGDTSPTPGDYFYDDETEASVSATASPGWRLEYWILDSVNIGAPNPCEVFMNKDHVLEAVFVPIPQYTLTINIIGSGTTDPTQGDHLYTENALVSVDAYPNPNWKFDHWILDSVDVGSANPYEVTMDSDHTLTAVFVELPPPQHELTIQVIGSGTTSPVPNNYLYNEGTHVQVDAFPSEWWALDHWTLDSANVGNANPFEVTMNEDHVLVAVFTEMPPPTIESCNLIGTRKDSFLPSEIVYANGSGYLPLKTYNLYLVEDLLTWTNGMPIPAAVAATTVTSDSSGVVNPTLVWNPALKPGKYDIIVDVDGDGVYDANRDALDTDDIEITAGLFVIPEYSFGVIMGLAGFFSALLVFRVSKKRKMPRL